jgi:hypothetical protein
MPYLRLRQVCLVAQELDLVVNPLCQVLGLQVCHRDPGVERFGLHNALMRIGSAFIEVVAPLPGSAGEHTAATRHLARQGGDSGYMVILDCDEVAPWRTHMARVGVREAAFHEVLEAPEAPQVPESRGHFSAGGAPLAYTGLQLHPRDTGGTLLEINHTPGGASLDGPYWPAGPHWQDAADCALGAVLGGATLRALHSAELAARWSGILQRPLRAESGAQHIALDNAMRLNFAAPDARHAAGFSAVTLRWPGVRAAFESAVAGVVVRARALGCLVDEKFGAVKIGGVWWQFESETFK